jgi:hypothetical protein
MRIGRSCHRLAFGIKRVVKWDGISQPANLFIPFDGISSNVSVIIRIMKKEKGGKKD